MFGEQYGFEFYEGEVPARVMFVQAFGHGPVYYRTFGQFVAYCTQPGCGYRGPHRTTPEAAMREAVAHLEMVTGRDWQEVPSNASR